MASLSNYTSQIDENVTLFTGAATVGTATTPLDVRGMTKGVAQGTSRTGTFTTAVFTVQVSAFPPSFDHWINHPTGVAKTGAGATAQFVLEGWGWVRLLITTAEGAVGTADFAVGAWR